MAETDCSRCAALCCVALSFDRSPHFALSKAAGVPCVHLRDDDSCAIHAERANRGFGGCVRYDCLGAGPRSVRAVNGSWREDHAVAEAIFDAFRVEREIAEARELLAAARALALSAADEARRTTLVSELEVASWPEVAPRVQSFFRSLRRLPLIDVVAVRRRR